jgi:hypothetical protein
MRIISWIIFLFIIFGACSQALFSDKIDLVELKKKEKLRQKNKKKPSLVITNDNIGKLKFQNSRYSLIQVNPGKQSNQGLQQVAALKKPPRNQTREYWQALKKDLESKISHLEETVREQQLRLNKLHTDHLIMDLPYQKAALKKQIDELTPVLNANKQKLKNQKQELAALSDKARKAGVPPGWLR